MIRILSGCFRTIICCESDASNSGFWTEGAWAYEKALREEYEAQLLQQRARCDQREDEKSRAALEAELRAKEERYRNRLKGIGQLLF